MTHDDWFEVLGADDALDVFAERALTRRLYAVGRLLPIVAASDLARDADSAALAEAIRRSRVALALFRPLLVESRADALDQQLQLVGGHLERVIRSAKLARSLELRGPLPDCVVATLAEGRVKWRRRLWRAWVELDEGDRLMALIRSLLRTMIHGGIDDARSWCEREMHPRVADFVETRTRLPRKGRELVRIRPGVRQLEAELELLGGGSSRTAQSAISQLLMLEDRLGVVTDEHRAMRAMKQIHPADGTEERHVRRLEHEARAAREAAADDLRAWWTGKRLAPLRALLSDRPVAA